MATTMETKSSDAEWVEVSTFTVDFFRNCSRNVVVSPLTGEFDTALACTFVGVVDMDPMDPMDPMNPIVAVSVDGLDGEYLFELSRLGVYTVVQKGENKGECATMVGCDGNRIVYVLDGSCKKITIV